MPSTYSNIKIQLMATGENNTTWGNVTNINLGTALEEAIVGSADVTFASGNVTLTLTDTNASQTARHVRLRCTGVTGGSTRDLIVPAIEKPYLVQNDCLNSIVVKNATGTGITVPAGKTMWVYNDGTNVVDAVNHLSSLTLGTALPVGQGGTGASTFTANGIIYGNTTSALLATAAGTTGQVLVGNTGGAPSWATLTGIGVTSFSGGTTGLTPASPTTGAITLAGTLGVANGGTGTATQFTAGSVVFAGASGVYSQDNANLFWDDTNNRLGVGTTSPLTRLHVSGGSGILVSGNGVSGYNYAQFSNDVGNGVAIGVGGSTASGWTQNLATVFNASNNPLAFGTNNLERMRIDSAGNVGIGTAAPGYKLDVVGGNGDGIQFRTSTRAIGIGQVSSEPTVFWGSGTPLTFFAGSELMRITGAGNVGIGTTTPGALLEVNTGSSATTGLIVQASGLTSSQINMGIGVVTAGRPFIGTNTNTNPLEIGTRASADLLFLTDTTERMRISAVGNVGIGVAPIANTRLYVRTAAVTDTAYQADNGSNSGFIVKFASSLTSIGNDFASPLAFLTNNTERMRIDGAGVVAIATSSPTAGQLHIAGTGELRITNPANSSGFDIGMWGGTGDPTAYIYQRANSSVIFGTNNAARMIITNTGAVGVGTTGPSYPLEVRQDGASGATYIGSVNTTATGSAGVAGYLARAGSNFSYFYMRGDGVTYVENGSNNPLVFATNGSERMRITAAGVIGINTSSPSSGLDVNSIAIWCGTKTASSGSGGNIRFRDDTGTFRYATGILGSPAETSYSIYDNVAANSRLTITSTGNVGIGTITPNSLLQSVYGVPTSVPAAGAGGHGLAVGSPGYGIAGGALTSGSGYLQVTRWDGTATNYNLILQPNGGDVGIGTASPSAKLDVNGTGYFSDNVSIVRTNTAGSLTGLTINNAGTTAAYAGVQVSSGTVTSQFFNDANGNAVVAGAVLRTTTNHPFVFGTNATERMRITSAGNVGIGTTAPQTNLEVAGPLDGVYNANVIISSAVSSAKLAFNPSGAGSAGIGTASGGLIFYANGANTERMRIDSSGNVGIGTSSPGGGANDRQLTLSGSSSAQATFATGGITNAIGTNTGVGYVGTTSNHPFIFTTNNSERARIDTSGNFLVGTTTASDTSTANGLVASGDFPGYIISRRVSGAGQTHLNFVNGGASVGSIVSSTTATTYNTSSDYRLKDIDGPIVNSGAYIDALKPVQGSWKSDGSRFIGLLAHEVQEVSETPIATGEKDGEAMQAMDYSAPEIIANLIAEIQSLRARVAQLEGK